MAVPDKAMMTSYSQVQMFARCRLSWWFRYVAWLRPVERTDHKRLLGRAFHEAVQDRNAPSDLIVGNPRRGLYSDPVIVQIGVNYVREHITPDVLAGWDEEWGSFDPTRSLSVMLEMLDLSTLDPSSTEDRMYDPQVELEVEIDGFTGRIDLVYRIEEGGPLVVRDWKTTSRLDAVRAVLSPQLPVYAWMLSQVTGEMPLWVEVVQVSNVPSATPALTKPSKKYPEGRLALSPNRYTPRIYTEWCAAQGIEPDQNELARLHSPAHVAGFVQTARKLVTPVAVDSARDWMVFHRDEMKRESGRPQGCRDPKVCQNCVYASVCLDLQDTGAVKPAEEYGMEIGES